MAPYVLTVRTASAATSVQIQHSPRWGAFFIEHLEAPPAGAEVEVRGQLELVDDQLLATQQPVSRRPLARQPRGMRGGWPRLKRNRPASLGAGKYVEHLRSRGQSCAATGRMLS